MGLCRESKHTDRRFVTLFLKSSVNSGRIQTNILKCTRDEGFKSELTPWFYTHPSKALPTRISCQVAWQSCSLIGCVQIRLCHERVKTGESVNSRALGSQLSLVRHLSIFHSLFSFCLSSSHIETRNGTRWALCYRPFRLSSALKGILTPHQVTVQLAEMEKSKVQDFSSVGLVLSSLPHFQCPSDFEDSYLCAVCLRV